jgi:hypothetical protein
MAQMRASIHVASNMSSMVLGAAGCGQHRSSAAVAAALRVIKRSVNVRPRAGLLESPAMLLGVFDRVANLLVGMVGDRCILSSVDRITTA